MKYIAVVASLALAACNLGKKEDAPQPASTETATAVQTGAPQAADTPAPAADHAATAAPTAKSGSDPAPDSTGKPQTIAQKGEKKVATTPDGTNVRVQNESGKGSVVTSGGKTTVTGKSGRSISIPIGR